MSKLKLLLFAAFVFAPALLLAQAPDPSPTPIPPIAVVPNYISLATAVLAAAITFLSPLITGLAKKFGPQIPRWALPMIVAGLGVLIQWVSTLGAGGGVWTPVYAIVLAGFGSWLRTVLLTWTGGDGGSPGAAASKSL